MRLIGVIAALVVAAGLIDEVRVTTEAVARRVVLRRELPTPVARAGAAGRAAAVEVRTGVVFFAAGLMEVFAFFAGAGVVVVAKAGKLMIESNAIRDEKE